MIYQKKTVAIFIATYADDTFIACQGTAQTPIQAKLQNYINRLIDWFSYWRIKINTEKTTGIIFSRQRQPFNIEILMQETTIPWDTSIKYLGLHFDKKLNWEEHIQKTSIKTHQILAQLYSLLNRSSRLSLTNKIMMYKSIIRPAITYGCEIWGSCTKTRLNRIQVLQNKILRTATNAPWFVRNNQIHNDLGIPYISEFIKSKAEDFYARIQNCENNLVANLGNYQTAAKQYKWPKTIIEDPDEAVQFLVFIID